MRTSRILCLVISIAMAMIVPLTELIAQGPGAPVVTRAIPDAAKPGDLLILEGTNLNNTTQVRFTAIVGGFAGMMTIDVAPGNVSANRITAIVPGTFGFAPPNATPPGDPLGTVGTLDVNGIESSAVPFFFMQATFGEVTTTGQGTTQTNGLGRPAISFDHAGGAPVGGNNTFVCTVANTTPGSVAWLFAGTPTTTFLPSVGDGLFAIDLINPPLFSWAPIYTDAAGTGSLNIPLPTYPITVIITGVFQWAIYDPGASPIDIAISNALQFRLQ